MHRDKKLGLALGVLLVGIVAAFFFRNDRAPEPAAPKLERPQTLDDRIAERPFSPYLPPESEGATRNASHGTDARRSDRDDESGLADTMRPVPFGQESHGNRGTPEPIPAFSDDTDRPRGRTPEHNRDWTPVSDSRSERTNTSSRAAASTYPASESRSADVKIHEVRPGETLSGIAAKHLGSSTKFHEIYQANRDQLKSPNDLRAGMKLRIPRKIENTASGRDTTGTRTSPETRNAPPSRDRRAETEPAGRSSAALGDPDFRRNTADRGGSRNTAPTRNISSRPFDDDQPFPSDAEPSPRRAVPPAQENEESAGHLFRPARTNPLPRGDADRNGAALAGGARTAPGRSLSQRLPDDFPELDEREPRPDEIAPRPNPFGSEPAPKRTTSEFPATDIQPFSDAPRSATKPTARPSAGTGNSELAPGRYLVRRGDTLEKIAQRLLGDRNAASRILEANRDLLGSTDDLREGMSLAIPR